MTKSLKARVSQLEAQAKRDHACDNLPPLEWVDERDVGSRAELAARVAEITSRYPPDYAGIKVMIVERTEAGGSV